MKQSLQIRPYSLDDNEGRRLESLAALAFVKAGTWQTGGAFNLFEMTGTAGFATPLHIHYAEDVAFFLLEGSLTVSWGDQKKEVEAGAYFFEPRGLPHGFRVKGDSPARLLYLAVPAGFDRFVEDISLGASGVECIAVAARHQIEVLGPLPE